jgi:Zn-dependent metalloprotease
LQFAVDPTTGTPAHLAATDGYLTAQSTRSSTAIVRAYLRANAGALGLTRADLDTFRLRTSNTDSSGVTHLSYEQVARGIPVFGNGLKAHLTRRGELISVQGRRSAGSTG